MRQCWIRAIGPIIASIFIVACGVDGDGDENPPTTKTYAYATSANGIYAFSVNTDTGALTEVPGSPFTDGKVAPAGFALEPSGRFVYVANESSASISIFAINAPTGALTPLTGSPFVAWNECRSIEVDPLGRFLYMAVSQGGVGFGGSVAAYTIDKVTGLLTEAAGSPYVDGIWPVCVAIHPSGKFAYVIYRSEEVVRSFAINTDTGAITAIAGSNTSERSVSIQIHPSGKFAYEMMSEDSIRTHSIDADIGKLKFVSSFHVVESYFMSFVIHPSGQFAYVAGVAIPMSSPPSITAFSIDAATGQLIVVAELPISDGWHNVAIDPSGKFLYVSGSGDNVSAYEIDAATGVLTEVANSPLAVRESLGRLQFINIAQ